MAVGLMRGQRFTDGRQEAIRQRKSAEKAEPAIGRAKQERRRAQEATAELAWARAEYEAEIQARFRGLEPEKD